MKSLMWAVAAVAALVSASADATQALARRNACTNCHAAEATTRSMPSLSFPELAAKYADVSDDELVKRLREGTTDHPRIRGTEAQTRDIIRWMRTLK